jgi:hypothetical protein
LILSLQRKKSYPQSFAVVKEVRVLVYRYPLVPPRKPQLGGAAKEKQHHLDIVAARGKSTGIESTPSYAYFIIGFRWCIFDEFGSQEWRKERDHSVTIDNVHTTTELIRRIRKVLYDKIK